MTMTSLRPALRGASTATTAATRVSVRNVPVRRWNSSQEAKSSAAPSAPSPPPSASSSNLGKIAALVVAGGAGAYIAKTFIVKGETGSSKAPGFFETTSDKEIPVVSPVKVLTLEECNAKIREQAQSFVFEGKDGGQGRIDLVRVDSNSPVEDRWAIGYGKGLNGANTLFTGVYDGHAGWATAAVLKEALIPYVSSALSQVSSSSPGDVVDSAIKNAFVRLDDRIMDNAKKATEAGYSPGAAEVISALAPAIAGSCALLTIYDPAASTLRTAIAGDCRAVLGSWSPQTSSYTADQLSQDQTGFNQDEVNRLDKAHPGEKADILSPESGRLMGLAITRAFGDHRWKWSNDFIKTIQGTYHGWAPRPQSKSPPYLTARPEVTTRNVQTEDFVILASDGLWDVISSEDAVTCVSRWLTARRAGKPETVTEAPGTFTLNKDNEANWKATPDMFAIEDLDSAAVCLYKNAMGGRRRDMFRGTVSAYSPLSRYVRDDVTVQVVFFKDPYANK